MNGFLLTVHGCGGDLKRGATYLPLGGDELPVGQLLGAHHLDVAGTRLYGAQQLDGRGAVAARLRLNRLLLDRLLGDTYTTTNI